MDLLDILIGKTDIVAAYTAIDIMVEKTKKSNPGKTEFIERWEKVSSSLRMSRIVLDKMDQEATVMNRRNFTLESLCIEQKSKIVELENLTKNLTEGI